MSEIIAWTQWSDLKVPAGVKLLSQNNFPLESSDLSKINFFVPSYMGGATALAFAGKMENLKVLQMPNAGYDDALAYLRPGLILCNASGVHDASTAELAVTLALSSRRGIPDFVRDQDKENWNHHRLTSLSDSKIGIVGYGFSPLKLPADLDFMALFHGVDERIPLESLDFGVKALEDFLLNS